MKQDYSWTASVVLSWSSDCQPKQVIPKAQLYPGYGIYTILLFLHLSSSLLSSPLISSCLFLLFHLFNFYKVSLETTTRTDRSRISTTRNSMHLFNSTGEQVHPVSSCLSFFLFIFIYYSSTIHLLLIYYSSTTFTNLFTFVGSPSGLPSNGFSIKWTGYIMPTCSGSYTFYTTSDDGTLSPLFPPPLTLLFPLLSPPPAHLSLFDPFPTLFIYFIYFSFCILGSNILVNGASVINSYFDKGATEV